MSSNRDENPHRRAASLPVVQMHGDYQIVSPVDGEAGGTWMGMRNDDAVVILLNGAFCNHQRTPPYKISRGKVVNHLLKSEDITAAYFAFDLSGIEPFSLVIRQYGNLHHLVWDGAAKHHRTPHPEIAHIWSSATLYDAQIQQRRRDAFANALATTKNADKHWLENFLMEAMPEDEQNRFVMKRGDHLQTLSIALIEVSYSNMLLNYIDLSNRPAQRYAYHMPVIESVQHEQSRLAATVH